MSTAMMMSLALLASAMGLAHGQVFDMFLKTEEEIMSEVFSLPNFEADLDPSPLPNKYSCMNDNAGKKLNNFHMRGTALGGWLVLEPWITPSLFYQFLGASEKWGDDAKNRIGIDSKTFCLALGDDEANRQLRNHWKTWVTEEQIAVLAATGIDTIRIPVADWMYDPYEPFIGCWDGALEELDRVLALIEKYHMKALLDVHTERDSQNGLDNSGDTASYKWVDTYSTEGDTTMEHWDIRGANWLGHYNISTGKVDSINTTNFMHSLRVVNNILDRYKDVAVVSGIEPVNEPWGATPIKALKEFYWRIYQMVQLKAPHWVTLLHDSFHLDRKTWDSFLRNCNMYAFDTHIYQAWANPATPEWFRKGSCSDGFNLRLMEALGHPVIVGEWSLATDNCAMWLNGFNDNVPTYPKVECKRVECPQPYTNIDTYSQPGAPPNPLLPAQDPFGTGGESYVEYGTCPIDLPYEEEDKAMRIIAMAKLNSFDQDTHGHFFWNFRTELPEPRWSYQLAVENGWLPKGKEEWGSNAFMAEVRGACIAEDPLIAVDDMGEGDGEQVEGVEQASSNPVQYIKPTGDIGAIYLAVFLALGGFIAVGSLLWLIVSHKWRQPFEPFLRSQGSRGSRTYSSTDSDLDPSCTDPSCSEVHTSPTYYQAFQASIAGAGVGVGVGVSVGVGTEIIPLLQPCAQPYDRLRQLVRQRTVQGGGMVQGDRCGWVDGLNMVGDFADASIELDERIHSISVRRTREMHSIADIET